MIGFLLQKPYRYFLSISYLSMLPLALHFVTVFIVGIQHAVPYLSMKDLKDPGPEVHRYLDSFKRTVSYTQLLIVQPSRLCIHSGLLGECCLALVTCCSPCLYMSSPLSMPLQSERDIPMSSPKQRML